MDEQEREKYITAVLLASGHRAFADGCDEHRRSARRVVDQVILPLLRKAWDEGYGSGRDDEAVSLGFYDPSLPHITGTPNPYRAQP